VAVREGPLVVADISGYTAFVAETELEHSRAILNELLEMLVRGLARHLRIGQIEGDAVFGVGERMPPRPIEWLEECFVLYQRRLRDIQEISTCGCRACTTVASLTLKFVAHYGEYMPQRLGDKQTYVGRDVNIVHRLLKNSVPSHEYFLATSSFLDRLPATARAGFVPHQEKYDAGEVAGGYVDFGSLREAARSATDRRLVESDHARLTLRRSYHTTHERLWQVFTDAETKRRWMNPTPRRLDYWPGVHGTLLGAEYHCEHGSVNAVYRVVATAPPDQLTTVVRTPLTLVWETSQVRDEEPGQVQLVRSFHWERPPGLRGWLSDALEGWFLRTFEGKAMKSIDAVLRLPTPAKPPAEAPARQ
jgi:class 3 adenylate cyclase/uncharacterized protein YndB with AHSA1/START domain